MSHKIISKEERDKLLKCSKIFHNEMVPCVVDSPVNFPRQTAIAADNAEGIYEVHSKKLPPMFLSSNNGYFRIYHPLINGVQMGRANK